MTVFAMALAGARPSAAVPPGPCPEAVDLVGPPAVIEGVAAMLSRRGIALAPAAGCAPTRAAVAPEGDGYSIAIDDADGRHSQRKVLSLESAGTLIETWVRPDLGPLPAPREPEIVPVARSAARPVSTRWLGMGAAFETAVAERDRSLWLGGQLFAGALWGPLWLGGKGRLSREQLVPGARSDQTERGTDAAVLLEVGWPVALGRLDLVPSVGLGCGWWWAARATKQEDNTEETEASSGPTLRTEVGLSLRLPLTSRLSALGGLTADYLPRGVVAADDDNAPIAPRGYLRLALGLRLDGP